ncbi:SDR family oxidoreductase [Mesobacterium pallidum]|uniref:SDR family oxidoreductase n=1 Tax=Mesobacterium pallidum TaxID=2872037 RepID=UPI001EE3816C|nr:SDR family oxidoreductase [Mesobacterium pallidum]
MSERVVIITGGAAGIGWATAQRFAADGCRVVIADLTGADEAAARLGAGHTGVTLDITDAAAVEAMVAGLDRIDVLVNNAGIGDSHLPSLEQDIAQFRKVLDIHVTGAFLVARACARRMIDAGGGAIVNLSSIAGVTGLPRRNAYGAAKAGIAMMTRSLACEWAGVGVRVNAVAPGYARTALVEKLVSEGRIDLDAIQRRVPQGRLIDPSEIAEAIWFLASPAASAITGVTLSVDGGWAAFGDFGDAS